MARAGLIKTGDHINEHRLACAIGAHQRKNFTLFQIQTHRLKRNNTPESFGDTLN